VSLALFKLKNQFFKSGALHQSRIRFQIQGPADDRCKAGDGFLVASAFYCASKVAYDARAKSEFRDQCIFHAKPSLFCVRKSLFPHVCFEMMWEGSK
jgi:hypothetical protein